MGEEKDNRQVIAITRSAVSCMGGHTGEYAICGDGGGEAPPAVIPYYLDLISNPLYISLVMKKKT
ncbi:MAG: hypothetical protein E3J35_08660 [Methanomassiliicoccales archaeon]|nr:MAG: hypothetical protein E3J35_08660 [Methanomassiliicoccales archaeon]